MSKKHILKIEAAGLNIGFDEIPVTPRQSTVTALTSHILRLARLDETTLSDLMCTAEARLLTGGARVLNRRAISKRQKWSDLKPASPAPMSDAQYAAFLNGRAT